MKKSVVILIAVIYVAAIALVSFFGLQFKIFEQVIPVEKIEITNDGLKYNETWGDCVFISPDSNGERKFQIKYKLTPDGATNSKVAYSTDGQNAVASVDESGLVSFQGPGMIKVIINATDGSGAKTAITVICIS